MLDKIKITGNSTETAPDLKYGPNQEYSFGNGMTQEVAFLINFK
jgi:hypothetical protein